MSRDPSCSIVIPTHRRLAQLRECLDAVERLDYPRELLEVIVVDDGGGGLEDVVKPLRDRLDVTLLSQPHAGPAQARNTGAARANGELLAFTDDDCRPAQSWLRVLADRHRAEPDVALGGRTVNALADNAYAETSQMIIDVGYEFANRDPRNAFFFATNNLAVPSAGFHAVGGFDVRFTTSEDREFCARWVAHGLRMTYVPDAVVHHASTLTFARFCRQNFRYGRGAFRYHLEQARRHRRVGIEPAYYVALARDPFRRESQRRGLPLLALLGAWHLANTAGFAWEAMIQGSSRRRD